MKHGFMYQPEFCRHGHKRSVLFFDCCEIKEMIEIKNEGEGDDEDYCCLPTLVGNVPVTLHMT